MLILQQDLQHFVKSRVVECGHCRNVFEVACQSIRFYLVFIHHLFLDCRLSIHQGINHRCLNLEGICILVWYIGEFLE